jgi:hypothetical protein
MPCEYNAIPAHRDAAEQRYLWALKREARGTNKPAAQVSVPRRASPLPSAARTIGRTAGAGFAALSRDAYNRMSTYTRALEQGEREAARRDAEERAIAQDAGRLREWFPGRDDEDDNDF